jgi:AraC-like DNA-binding protein
MDDRLAALWAGVETALDRPWTLELLAATVHTSPEALRKRCLHEMGRSPMQHVTYIRMQRARHLLEYTQDKLDVVAERLGFSDGMTFSSAFKRWIGLTPSDYRQRH